MLNPFNIERINSDRTISLREPKVEPEVKIEPDVDMDYRDLPALESLLYIEPPVVVVRRGRPRNTPGLADERERKAQAKVAWRNALFADNCAAHLALLSKRWMHVGYTFHQSIKLAMPFIHFPVDEVFLFQNGLMVNSVFFPRC